MPLKELFHTNTFQKLAAFLPYSSNCTCPRLGGGRQQQQWLKACTGQAGELLTASTVAVMRFLQQKLFLSHGVNCKSITDSFACPGSNGLPLVWLRFLASHTTSVCCLYFVEFSDVDFLFCFGFFFNTSFFFPPGG